MGVCKNVHVVHHCLTKNRQTYSAKSFVQHGTLIMCNKKVLNGF